MTIDRTAGELAAGDVEFDDDRHPVVTWSEVRLAAMVGSSRRPFAANQWAASQPVGIGAEAGLLRAAALLGVERIAGQKPAAIAATTVAVPCPDELLPEASPTACQLLDVLVAGGLGAASSSDPMLLHWLSECARTEHRIPARLLVRVLERASAAKHFHQPARQAIGERGRWLAVHHDRWSWAAESLAEPASIDSGAPRIPTTGDAMDADQWIALDPEQRRAHLLDVRSQDPAAGRALLLAGWPGDAATVKVSLLGALRVGLCLDDDSFLDSLLDERSKTVRAAAIDMLAALPGSEFGRRMSVRLEPLIAVDGRIRKRLTVGVPAEPDDAAQRDGLPATGKVRETLSKIIVGSPLRVWTETTGLSIGKLLALISDDDIRHAIVRAAEVQANLEWAEQLIAVFRTPTLAAMVPPAAITAAVDSNLKGKDAEFDLAMNLLAYLPAPWAPTMGATVLDVIRGRDSALATLNRHAPMLQDGLTVDHVAALESWRSSLDGKEGSESLIKALRQLITSVSTRASITAAFEEPSHS